MTFNEDLHPRSGTGEFATKPQTGPEVTIAVVEPRESFASAGDEQRGVVEPTPDDLIYADERLPGINPRTGALIVQKFDLLFGTPEEGVLFVPVNGQAPGYTDVFQFIADGPSRGAFVSAHDGAISGEVTTPGWDGQRSARPLPIVVSGFTAWERHELGVALQDWFNSDDEPLIMVPAEGNRGEYKDAVALGDGYAVKVSMVAGKVTGCYLVGRD